jgi:putative transcriptional regulator
MTVPQHHPTEATLLAYAAGALGAALSLVVASHLAFCTECREAVAEGELIGGSLLDELAPVALAVGSRERVLARLGTAPPPPAPRLALADPLLPAPLARQLGRGLLEIEWRRLGPGLRQHMLQPHDIAGGNLRLLRIGSGRKIPRHGHSGTELTLVLQGSYTDELGHFGRGDVSETDSDIVHQPVSDRDEECICLIATEARLRFDGVIARVFQRFTGM